MFPEATGQHQAEQRVKELLWIEKAEKAKEAPPKTCSSFWFGLCFTCLGSLSAHRVPSESLSLSRIPSSCVFFCSFLLGLWSLPASPSWGSMARSPPRGCGTGTGLNPHLSHHVHFEGRGETIWHVWAEQLPHLQSPKHQESNLPHAQCRKDFWTPAQGALS